MKNAKPVIIGAVAIIAIIAAGVSAVVWRMNSIIEEQRQEHVETARASLAAGKFEIGGKLPDFEVQTVDGEGFALSDALDGDHYVVVNFHHPDCPCAENCSEMIADQMGEGYEDVKIIGILSEGHDNPRVMKALNQQKEDGIVTFPVYLDPDQTARNALAPTRTPETWVLDKDGTIRFWGAPESSLFPNSKDHRYLLKEAVDALRAGETPELQSVPPIGCLISS